MIIENIRNIKFYNMSKKENLIPIIISLQIICYFSYTKILEEQS